MRVVGVVVACASVLACSSVGKVNSLGRRGAYHLEVIGTSLGPSSATLGDVEASTLGGELFGTGAIIINGRGFGLRGGYVFDAATSDQPRIKYTGAEIAPMAFWGHPRALLYGGLGLVISGRVTPVGASTVLDERRPARALRPVVGAMVTVVQFNEKVSYRLFAEVPYLLSGDTDVGQYRSTSLLFGSLFTF